MPRYQSLCTTLILIAAGAASGATTSPDLTGPVMVTTRAPLSVSNRTLLEELGLTIHGPTGTGRFVGSVRPGASSEVIRGLASISSVERIPPEDRLDPVLAAGAPEWMVADVEDAAAAPIVAYVTAAGPETREAVAGAGVQVISEFSGNRFLVVSGTVGQIQALAQLDAVLYVEPAMPAWETRNDDNRARTGAGAAQLPPYDLDGAGVTAFVFDGGGVRTTHQDFVGRVTILDGAAPHQHATHVAGTLGGTGAASGGQYRGMAPAVQILSSRFQSGLGGTFFYTNPGDVEFDYRAAVLAEPNLGVANTSMGLNVTANNYPCDLFGNYGATSHLIDGFVAGSLGKRFTIAWAGGNDRPGRCGSPYGTISPPSAAKNPIVVGALNSDDDSMTTFSSWGPTDDGRLKPDVAAPGDQVSADGGVTSPNSTSNTAYTTLHGTSMASPTVAGLAALLIQDYRAHNPGAGDPLPSTIKALLMHTAADVEQAGPDYRTGYGSVRVLPAIDAMRGGRFVEDALTTGELAGFEAMVMPGDPELRLTLAWDDPPALPDSPSQLINDLDLVVTDPSGVRAYPWTLDPANPDSPAVRTQEDHRNNAEQVLVENPAAGLWRIEVRGGLGEGTQPFSLAMSHVLTPRGLRIRAADVLPSLVAPGSPVDIDVEISAFGESVVSAAMFYRFAPSEPFQSTPLAAVDGAPPLWRATLPATSCGDMPEVYFTATGSVTGTITSPPEAPSAGYGLIIGEIAQPFADDFELDQGWTVSGEVASGDWERGVPAGNGQRDPTSDFDGSGSCYVTGNALNMDLDGGETVLTSPVFDASRGGAGGAATLRYARWFNPTGSDPSADYLRVELSNDDGATWITLETIGVPASGINPGWVERTWSINDVLTPTANMRLRFTAADIGTASVVEAAVDAVRVSVFFCDDAACLCEWDGQAGVDVFDLLAYLDGWFTSAAAADVDGVPGVDVFDLLLFLDCWFSGC